MTLSTLLLLHLAAGEPISPEARELTRVRAGIHFAVAGAFSGFAPGIGPGFSTEIGATLADRYSIVVRLTLGTIIVVSVATLGLGFDLALSDRVSLGGAVAISAVGGLFVGNGDLPFSLTVFSPLRLVFAPIARADNQLMRKGLVLFVEAGPGYGLAMSGGFFIGPRVRPSPLSFEAAIGVGYAVW